MDKITEFLKELKIRLTSPLFSSFILSWLVINWKIVVILIWYNAGNLYDAFKYKSFIEAIEANTNIQNSVSKPVCGALIYTFGYPIIKNVIQAYQAFSLRWGGRWHLRISKNASVSIESFREQAEKYMNLEGQLEGILKTSKDASKQNQELIIARQEQEKRILELNNRYDRLQGFSRISYLDGNWRMTHRINVNNQPESDIDVRISNGSINKDDANGRSQEIAKIVTIGYDIISEALVLILSLPTASGSSRRREVFCIIRRNNTTIESDILVGVEGSLIMKMIRIK